MFFLLNALHTESDSLLFDVNAQHLDGYDVSERHYVGGMLYEFVGKLGYVHKTVLMHTDINERAKIYNVSDRTREHHIGLQILNSEDIVAKDGLGEGITDVAPGLLKLGDNIVERRRSYSESLADRRASLLGDLLVEIAKLEISYVLRSISEHLEKRLCSLVGLGVHSRIVKYLLGSGNAEEARALLIRLRSYPRNLKYLGSGGKLAVFLTVFYDILRAGGVNARDVRKKRMRRGIQVNANAVNAILNYTAESSVKTRGLHIVLILSHADSLGIDLYIIAEEKLRKLCL